MKFNSYGQLFGNDKKHWSHSKADDLVINHQFKRCAVCDCKVDYNDDECTSCGSHNWFYDFYFKDT